MKVIEPNILQQIYDFLFPHKQHPEITRYFNQLVRKYKNKIKAVNPRKCAMYFYRSKDLCDVFNYIQFGWFLKTKLHIQLYTSGEMICFWEEN